MLFLKLTVNRAQWRKTGPSSNLALDLFFVFNFLNCKSALTRVLYVRLLQTYFLIVDLFDTFNRIYVV